jgi:hypothetical protein
VFNYCDCPGFNDSRNIEKKICSSYSIWKLINSCKYIRAILIVIDIASIEDKNKLKDVITIFIDLFISDSILSNCIFVFTKVSKLHTPKKIIEVLERVRAQEEEQLNKMKTTDEERQKFQKIISFLDIMIKEKDRIVAADIFNEITKDEIESKIIQIQNKISNTMFNLEYNQYRKQIEDSLNNFFGNSLEIFELFQNKIDKLRKLFVDYNDNDKQKKSNDEFLREEEIESKKHNDDIDSKNNLMISETRNIEILTKKISASQSEKALLIEDQAKLEKDINDIINKLPEKNYGRVFRKCGFPLLRNSEDFYEGPILEVKLFEHTNTKQQEIPIKDNLKYEEVIEHKKIRKNTEEAIHVDRKSTQKWKIELIKETTATVRILVEAQYFHRKLIKSLKEKLERINKKIEDVDQKLNESEEKKKDLDHYLSLLFGEKNNSKFLIDKLRSRKIKIPMDQLLIEENMKKIDDEMKQVKNQCEILKKTIISCQGLFEKVKKITRKFKFDENEFFKVFNKDLDNVLNSSLN